MTCHATTDGRALRRRAIVLALAAGLHVTVRLPAADWPMWRCDAARTAVSTEQLPAELHLQWSRQLPKPTPAWPASQHKLQFDRSYEPVVVGSTLVVSSMVADSVTAYNTRSGTEMWRFYTDGPVRFAPACQGRNVFVGSDDGFIYCLRADTGALRWRRRCAPSDDRVLGNGRLISTWPVRGAPVVHDNVVYAAAGIWPFMGVFVCALDAEDGRVLWENSGSGALFTEQQHFSPAFAGIAPQGYLAAGGERLIVPGGRTVPAAYDRRTGEFLYLDLASRRFGKGPGGYSATLGTDWFINGGALYSLSDGAGLGPTADGLWTGRAFLSMDDDELVAAGLPFQSRLITNRGAKKIKGKKPKKIKEFSFRPLGRTRLAPAPQRLLCMAGRHVYGARDDGTLVAIETRESGASAEVVWQSRVDGVPWTALVADARLFMVTQDGKIHCFAAAQRETVPEHTPPATPQRETEDAWTARVSRTLPLLAERKGYCVLLGLGTGRLAAELLRQSDCHVIVVEPDAQRLQGFRRRMDAAGLYGRRIVGIHADPLSCALPPYMASLIALEEPFGRAPRDLRALLDRVFPTLRPYGGLLCLWGVDAARTELQSWAAANTHRRAELLTVGDAHVVRRAGRLPGAGSWTHQNADAGNTVVSEDDLVRAPLGLLWFGGPPNDPILPRHGHGPSPHVVGGRLFIEGRNLLRAVDVYTGRLLWERALPDFGRYYDSTAHQPGANEIGSNYVSMPDAVYVATPRSCMALDPATGSTLRTFSAAGPDTEGTTRWGFIAAEADLLVAALNPIRLANAKRASARPETATSQPEPGPSRTAIARGATWRYLAGRHPAPAWTTHGFDDREWPVGEAGFGYGDNDDATVLADMRGSYTAVYARHGFTLDTTDKIAHVTLKIRFDDAFIAYLNGKEVLRQGVRTGAAATARGVQSHEAGGQYQDFRLANAVGLLRTGRNVLALEGHNRSLSSSDFSLDPFLLLAESVAPEATTRTVKQQVSAAAAIDEATVPADYASTSRRLVVFDRHTGKRLWSRTAQYGFRHNAIVMGAGKIFCIDTLSPQQQALLARRGYPFVERPALIALDALSGNVLWRKDTDVFGTWLGYSKQHDLLLQAGSRARDRARDEVGKGLVAYRGRDGTVLWQNMSDSYSGPCLLHGNMIIAQGVAFDLETGRPVTRTHPLTGEPIAWAYKRTYGCNTAVGSTHLLTFRSAAAGFLDLERLGGTANLGGFKSGCSPNLIVADGVLSAPDYTRTCTCSYQNQTSLAFVPSPDVEVWTFNDLRESERPVRCVGLNLGAPGDRLSENGTLWLDCPSVGGPSPDLPVTTAPDTVDWFRNHSSRVVDGRLRWVSASGVEGLEQLTVTLNSDEEALARPYSVALCFAEPVESVSAGDRVFNVKLQGDTVLAQFDVVQEAGGPRRTVIRTFSGIQVQDTLEIALEPASPEGGLKPILCGVEIIAGPQ